MTSGQTDEEKFGGMNSFPKAAIDRSVFENSHLGSRDSDAEFVFCLGQKIVHLEQADQNSRIHLSRDKKYHEAPSALYLSSGFAQVARLDVTGGREGLSRFLNGNPTLAQSIYRALVESVAGSLDAALNSSLLERRGPQRNAYGQCSRDSTDCFPVEQIGEPRPPVPPRLEPFPNFHRSSLPQNSQPSYATGSAA